MVTPSAPVPAAPAGQARLILQYPGAGVEARLPALRLSRELQPSLTPAMDRATAQQAWQALQLTPDELITQRLQLLDAYTKQDSATANARAARAEAAKHKIKLNELQDTRWEHPAVYSAGAAFVGLAGLWLWERKKRVAAQRDASQWAALSAAPGAALLEPMAQSLPAAHQPAPNAMPLSAQPDRSQAVAQAGVTISDPIATHITPEDLQTFVAPLEPAAPVFQRPAPWWKRWGRKSVASHGLAAPAPAPAPAPAHAHAHAHAHALRAPDAPPSWALPAAQPAVLPARRAPAQAVAERAQHADSASAFITASGGETSIAFDDSQGDDLGMESPGEDFYASDAAALQNYNPMRRKLSDVDEAMEQLLEMRMAVQAMVDLGQLHAAKRLLDKHIGGMPHTCAWAYLVHLDLCSQMGQRDAFEDMRKRYREQFNRLAPYWQEVGAAVQTLDTYNRPVAELCAAWHSRKQARSLIATWLLGAQYSRRQFQLPAYYDLLDLYDMLDDAGNGAFVPSSFPSDGEEFLPSSHVFLELPSHSPGATR